MSKLLGIKRVNKVFLELMTQSGEEVVMIVGNGLAETCLSKVDQYVVVNVLGPDHVRATLLLHTVEQRIKLSCVSLFLLSLCTYFPQLFSQGKCLP